MEENKMGILPINKLLVSMSLPMMASMLVQALYNIVDSIFVGQYDVNALTAVSLAFPFQNLMIAVASGTGVGMNAMLSKCLGEKDNEGANHAAGNGLILSFLSAVLFALLSVFAADVYFRLQNPNPQIISYGKEYLYICGGLSFGIFGQVIFERMLQATGKTVYAMISQGVGAIINIILDPILIFGYFGCPKMGVAGAALATVAGQFVAMGVAFFFNHRCNSYIHLKPKYIKLKAKVVKRIYSVGFPSVLMVAIGSVMNFSLNKILSGFDKIVTVYGQNTGTIAMTVLGVYYKLQSFVFMPVFGLNNGMVPIIAYNYGAKHKDRIKKTIFYSILYAVAIMAVGLLFFQLMPAKLLALFNDAPSLISLGVKALRIISPCFVFAGFCIVSSSVYQAMGKGFYSLVVSAARQLLFLLPLAFIFAQTGNVDLVWLAFPMAEIIAVVLCCYFTKRLFKKVEI